MEGDIFFSGWDVLFRTLIIAVLAYPGMLLMLRISGHRTLAKMNAFDLIVTFALGSTLASVITSQNVALAQGLLAFALLVIMQFIVAWATSRSERLEGVINGEPVLLVYQGRLQLAAMRRARVTELDIMANLRSKQLGGLGDAEAVVLETNGNVSVVPRQAPTPPSALSPVPGYCDGNAG